MMQALQVEALGDALVMNTVHIPRPQKGQVLVKQYYSSMNSMDPKIMLKNPFKYALPFTVGWDVCGTITEVGEGVTKYAVGDEVFGATIHGGCFAEYVVAAEIYITKRIKLPADKAGACGIIFGTVYQALYPHPLGNLDNRKGQTMFIPGAGGGLGHLAVQLAKKSGLRVIGSASKPESIKVAKESGADHVINYSTQNVVEEVLKLTNQQGVDIVYDATYKISSFNESASVVKKGGAWIRCGIDQWNHAGISDEEARKIVAERGAQAGTAGFGSVDRDVPKSFDVCDQLYPDVAPVITRVVPFDAESIIQAEKENLSGKFYGKVIVKIA